MANLIIDGQELVGAKYQSGYELQTYDDGFGPLWVSRNSIGINGIVRAQTWEDAYSICEDEFFPEADETIDQIVKEYGFKREHVKIVRDASGERSARYPEDYPNGELAVEFVRWETIETPSSDAWAENELFQESFGFRPNGPNVRDTHKHGIYSKDLSGDSLDRLTPELLSDLGIVLDIKLEAQEWKVLDTSYFRRRLGSMSNLSTLEFFGNVTILRNNTDAFSIIGEGGSLTLSECSDVLYDYQPIDLEGE
jgi:hypothetical protein